MLRAHRTVLALAVAASVLVPAAAGARASTRCGAPVDFDGDGYTDLAIGVPDEDVGTRAEAGGVNVLYGASGGLSSGGNQFWTQDSAGIKGGAEEADAFGSALAAGDFDGDGRSDLAVGAPGEDTSVANTGSVTVIYGSRTGLSARDQAFTLDTPGIKGRATPAALFGSSLAAADFDGDGRDDLAIGIPNYDVQTGRSEFRDSAGSVLVVYGSSAGLSTRDQLWSQDSPGIEGAAEHIDHFGATLGTGDFDANGRCDLVVGSPDEALGSVGNTGALNVIYGSSSGLTASGDRFFSQQTAGVPGTAEDFDAFGSSFAAGDFDGDGFHDLAVGVPGEGIGSEGGAGVVHVFFGSRNGLTTSGTEVWSQDSPGIQESLGSGDAFGTSLAAGDFDRDGFVDLVVGAPHESRTSEPEPPEEPPSDPLEAIEAILSTPVGETVQSFGVVHVLHGSTRGISDRDQLWSQDSEGIAGASEQSDLFGFTLATGRFNAGTSWDLAIGVPNEGFSDITGAGATHVLYGSGDSLRASASQTWNQNSPGVRDVAERNDRLAFTMHS